MDKNFDDFIESSSHPTDDHSIELSQERSVEHDSDSYLSEVFDDSISHESDQSDVSSDDTSGHSDVDKIVKNDPSLEQEDSAFLNTFLNQIDPDCDDPFDPESFDEDNMKYVQPRDRNHCSLPNHELAQLDLLRLLIRSGCSLNIFDKIKEQDKR